MKNKNKTNRILAALAYLIEKGISKEEIHSLIVKTMIEENANNDNRWIH